MEMCSDKVSGHFARRCFVASAGLATGGLCAFGLPAMADAAGQNSMGGDLDAFIRSRMESAHVPGLSLAIIHDGRLLRAVGFGFANLTHQRSMRADALINVGSVTKTMTCTAVMQLWERKKFALDDDVNAYLSFPVRNWAYPKVPVTFRQLLTHTSSIADGPAYTKSYACGDSHVPLGQWLRDYLAAGGALHDPQRNFNPSKPGMQFRYSNVAYGLLGHLTESISGMSYSDYILKNVFAPLGMSRSRVLLRGMDLRSHATPYTYVKDANVASVEVRDPAWKPSADSRGGLQVPHCLYSFATPPDGFARTNATELSRFLRAYMNGGELDGHRVLHPETVAIVLSDQDVHLGARRSETPHGQGLTWRLLDNLGGGSIWGHSGGDPGISTLIALDLHVTNAVVLWC